VNRDELDGLNPRQFEELVASVFAGDGYEVSLTPLSRDGGVDVFAERTNNLGLPDQWIIECKFYNERPVGVELVRQLAGVRAMLNARNAALVTASRFTKDADMAASQLGIELIDREHVLSWLRTAPAHPTAPPLPQKQFQTVFISHSHKDFDFAARLNTALRERGVRTWFSHQDLDAGTKIHENIFAAIDSFDRLIVVLSEHSLKSPWVISELRRAYQKQRKEERNILFPVSLIPFDVLQQWTCFDADSGKDLAVELREFLIPFIDDWTDDRKFSQFVDTVVRGLASTNVA
jgi:hypothetical protein